MDKLRIQKNLRSQQQQPFLQQPHPLPPLILYEYYNINDSTPTTNLCSPPMFAYSPEYLDLAANIYLLINPCSLGTSGDCAMHIVQGRGVLRGGEEVEAALPSPAVLQSMSWCVKLVLLLIITFHLFHLLHPSIRLHSYLSICLYVNMSICLSVYLSIYLSVYLFICLSIYLSIYLLIYLSIYLSSYLSMQMQAASQILIYHKKNFAPSSFSPKNSQISSLFGPLKTKTSFILREFY